MEHAATRASPSDECGRPLRLTQERVLGLTPCLFCRSWRQFHQVLRLNKNALYLGVLFADGILQMLDGLGHLGRAQVIGKVYVEGRFCFRVGYAARLDSDFASIKMRFISGYFARITSCKLSMVNSISLAVRW